MKLNVNPTRMVLTGLKRRLVTAKRGHKLLKDKQDELMRRFIELAKKNNDLRKALENELTSALKEFMLAASVSPPEFMEEALSCPKEEVSVEVTTKNIMSVNVPVMQFKRKSEEVNDENINIYPYGFYNTSSELDSSIDSLNNILNRLLNLAETEKTCQLMADEIEKTRRRVNALEYMTIPQLEETIRYIKMKLDENERSNLTRLMKVKSMMEQNESY